MATQKASRRRDHLLLWDLVLWHGLISRCQPAAGRRHLLVQW